MAVAVEVDGTASVVTCLPRMHCVVAQHHLRFFISELEQLGQKMKIGGEAMWIVVREELTHGAVMASVHKKMGTTEG